MSDRSIAPHGGRLIDCSVTTERAAEATRLADEALRLPVDRFTAMDALNIAIGAYSPLDGFLEETDYRSVTTQGKLRSGLTWPVPVLLHVPDGIATRLKLDASLTLVDTEAQPFALLTVKSVFKVS